jgi:hypothetical protein
MQCECDHAMKLVDVWDDAQETDHAFNLYLCDRCGAVLKHDVWNDAGKTWIHIDGGVAHESGGR